jgi:hypothetical protein
MQQVDAAIGKVAACAIEMVTDQGGERGEMRLIRPVAKVC